MAGTIIETKALTKRYGALTAVDDLNLTVRQGEVFGLLGPNGAGKTTTTLMLLGLTEPTAGSASISGVDCTRNPIQVKRFVGYLPDNMGFYPDMTGRQNLRMTGAMNGLSGDYLEARIDELVARVGMTEAVDRRAGTYSKGMKQRLGIADIPGFTLGENGMLALADCAITAQPDAKDLAGIAIASADTVRTLLGWEPRVAMLAFSTCGSAEHESVEVVRQAVELAKKLRPELKIDGEFQLDAAILPQTARKKVKRESSVAGKANVLIFPNLHAGNIGVKLIQIFGHANAYGPVLQGFAKPVCDFSRSAPVEEMLGNVAMLVIRAGSEEREGI